MLDTDAPNWPYLLGQQFVAAATSCGFECGRAFVWPGITPEGMPPECPCQIAVVVSPGWRPEPGPQPGNCVPIRQAVVRVYLDLCLPEAGGDAVLQPQELNTSSSVVLTALWQVLAGLQRARYHGNIADGCGHVFPAGWEPVSQEGAMARWVTTWRVSNI